MQTHHQSCRELGVVATPGERVRPVGVVRGKGALLQAVEHKPRPEGRAEQVLQRPVKVELGAGWPTMATPRLTVGVM